MIKYTLRTQVEVNLVGFGIIQLIKYLILKVTDEKL